MDIQVEMMKNRRINCERIILRTVTMEDATDMFEYASDEETVLHVFEKHKSVEETENAIAHYFMAAPTGRFAIEQKETNKMIGTIDLRIIKEDQIAELGYTLNKEFWGKGYMNEAATALLKLAFETLKLEKVFAMHDLKNPASANVMTRLGMQREGVLRSHYIHKGNRVDMAYYGILKEEYVQRKQNKETSIEF